MTKLIDEAIEKVRSLPPDAQDQIAKLVLSYLDDNEEDEEDIDPDHLEDVLIGIAEAERGEFASEEDLAALFAKHRL